MKNLTWQNPEQLFVAQELINKVKSKCCGIKDKKKIILLSNDKFEQNKRRLLNLLDNDISFYPLNVEQFYLTFFKPNNH